MGFKISQIAMSSLFLIKEFSSTDINIGINIGILIADV